MLNRRLCIFFFTALLIVAAVIALTPVSPVPRVTAANRSIALVGLVSAWNSTRVANPTITVTQGDIAMLTLSSGDTMHQFALDVDKDGARFIGSCPVGDTCSSVFTPSSGTSISITTASLAPSTYTYFCTFHSSMVGSFVVSPPPDFSITPNPTSLTLAPSSSGTTSITLTSTNGFSGTLTLSATVSPSGPQVSLNPTSVSLSAGGSVPSTLTVSTVSSGYYSTPVAQGNYAVNITASSGSLVHSTSVPLTVGSTSSAPPSSPSLPLLPIAGGVIAAIAVAGVALFLRRRSR